MKRTIALILSVLTVSASLISCKMNNTEISDSSSEAYADSTWLENRLGEIPDGVTVGTADKLGIDMTEFENDGYILRTNGNETVICGKTAEGLDMAVRRYAKAVDRGEVGELDITYHEGYRIKSLIIGGAGISEFTVINPHDGNENIDFAVSEFVRLIEKATGVTLPVADSADGHKVTFFTSDKAEYKADGYAYEVKNGNLGFEGAYDRGNSNGVWRFMEKELHWNGLIYGDSVLECADLLEIPDGTSRSETPAFAYYCMYNECAKSYKNDKGNPTSAQTNYGTLPVACHGMQNYQFCENDYGATQICYNDEDRYEECLENVTAYIEKRLNSGERIGKEFKCVDIAQGDTQTFCNCKECMRVYKEEKSNSGSVVRFANRLSEELNEAYPGLYYLIFAYCGTNMAPAVTKPNEQIYVSFCFDGNCSNHRMDGSECDSTVALGAREQRSNKTYGAWLESWSAVTDKIYVWYYDLDTCLKQYNVFSVLLYDMQYLRNNNVQGVFWQCQNYGLGCQYLQHMVAAELNWDTYMTEEEYEALICRVLQKEFGDGAECIRGYLKMQSASQKAITCWHCWGTGQRIFYEEMVAERFEETYDRFEEAMYLADSAMQERQTEILSIHAYYNGCLSGYKLAYLENDEAKIQYWCDIYDEMVKRVEKYGYHMDRIPSTDGHKEFFFTDLIHEAWEVWVNGYVTPTGTISADRYYSELHGSYGPLESEKTEK